MKKRILTFILAICLIIPCLFMYTACSCDEGSDKTMQLSMNPDVTFVLDGKNNIVSVSYDNQDAGTIYANIDFTGKNVEEAIKLFIEQSAISGHVNFNGEDVEIVVNGSVDADIQEVKDIAKAQVEETFGNLGVEVEITLDNLTETARKASLVSTAKFLSPEKTTAELEAMDNAELIELIKTKQQEYKGLAYTQITEIQSAFSSAQNAILQAIELLRTSLDLAEAQLESLGDLVPESVRTQIEDYKTQIEEKITEFINAKSAEIESAKAQYETKKAELVNAFKTQVAQAETSFKAHLDSVKTAGNMTQEQYDYWINLINTNKA